VGVTELLGAGRQMIERLAYTGSSQSVLIYGTVMLFFFIVCYPLTRLAEALELKARSE
jgi:polar amino acid transport system permease protein